MSAVSPYRQRTALEANQTQICAALGLTQLQLSTSQKGIRSSTRPCSGQIGTQTQSHAHNRELLQLSIALPRPCNDEESCSDSLKGLHNSGHILHWRGNIGAPSNTLSVHTVLSCYNNQSPFRHRTTIAATRRSPSRHFFLILLSLGRQLIAQTQPHCHATWTPTAQPQLPRADKVTHAAGHSSQPENQPCSAAHRSDSPSDFVQLTLTNLAAQSRRLSRKACTR